jgi:hypothetical protein
VPGLGTRLAGVRAELESVLAELDPDCLDGYDAAALYGSFAGLERLSVAGKTVLAPRVEASGIWREGGHRDAASLLASVEGVSAGQARGTLTNGRRLDQLPGTAEELRRGTLSAPKLTELCGAGVLDPSREEELLAGAAEAPLTAVQERCRRSRATSAGKDPLATTRKIHAERYFHSWTDPEGAFCFQGRDTADRGAGILNHLAHAADCLHRARRARTPDRAGGDRPGPGTGPPAADPPEEETGPISTRALWADAFYALVTQPGLVSPPDGSAPGAPEPTPTAGPPDRSSGPPAPGAPSRRGRRARGAPAPPGTSPPGAPLAGEAASVITRPPTCTTIVRVDLTALLRGRAVPGELCEIDGQGPIPVAMARDLANDSLLSVLFHQAGDVRAISHLGRTINAKLRTALVYRDRTCVVPGCGLTAGLEIDHVREVHQGGPTELDNLALLCHHHHRLKTYEGWVLTRLGVDAEGRTRWSFEPQPPFGQEPGLGIDSDEGRAEWRRTETHREQG